MSEHAPTGRDRLRELLDAVLDEENPRLGDMARDAHASPHHFARQVSRDAGEPPVALRRRVLLERAAWRLASGGSVTDAALEAGYDSVDGFARAFGRAYGHPPSATTAGTAPWLSAPNGIHFHPPSNLWVRDDDAPRPHRARLDPVLAVQLHHGVADTTLLLETARHLDAEAYRRVLLPGHRVHAWTPPEESVAALLAGAVFAEEVWVASIEGADHPGAGGDDLADLERRHRRAGPRWIAAVTGIAERDAWADRLVDALCEPPESFVLSAVVAHVLQYTAHRRLLVRGLLRDLGVLDDAPPAPDLGDPLEWAREPHRP
ncbi:helix-turn-helix transcriptional regulator [Nocardioides zeae]|uniref:Helix-turn-helix transcriptional regulator n=1 Tax=Nocardioides imazamoxiresistens TaxID=3231893 RepID=A0ABU3PWQ2_9ACTN|nr:helix-turn-helix transcriptional regulator [Nocardioides zeae]MDT9593663.1 helix-turn-helix transcriptional regulator [Nocardioides zeae]